VFLRKNRTRCARALSCDARAPSAALDVISRLSVLDEADVVGVFPEAAAAQVEAVLADQAAHRVADTAAVGTVDGGGWRGEVRRYTHERSGVH